MTEQNTQETIVEQFDPVIDYLKELQIRDAKIADPFIQEMLDMIKDKLENVDGFETKHAYIALSRTIAFVTQTMCKDQDEFLAELNSARRIVDNKIFPAIIPADENGNLPEGFDNEDLSIRRLMLLVPNFIDALFWKVDMSNYQEIRETDDKLSKAGEVNAEDNK